MKINIKATGIMLTEAIKNYVDKKISTLNKFLDNYPDSVVQVEVGKSTGHHKSGDVFLAEVHITGQGLDIYARSEQPDLYASIDIVRDEISQKILSIKDKKDTLTRRGGRIIKEMMKGINFFRRKN